MISNYLVLQDKKFILQIDNLSDLWDYKILFLVMLCNQGFFGCHYKNKISSYIQRTLSILDTFKRVYVSLRISYVQAAAVSVFLSKQMKKQMKKRLANTAHSQSTQ